FEPSPMTFFYYYHISNYYKNKANLLNKMIITISLIITLFAK
ncbi:unnamed protein product, partial [marine sediment metagenome]